MAKTWSADNPKAALMDRKRAAIVAAATTAFLDAGYAEASVNQIAADAGISIKTLYRHFESKDDLFSAVMQAACGRIGGAEDEGEPPPWYAEPPAKALAMAGEEYLNHALSPEQLALYQVVTRDAHRFPEVGRRYHDEVIGGRDAKFAGYLDLWAGREGWTVHDRTAASEAFAGLLKAGIFDQVLQGRRALGEAEIAGQAAEAGRRMLILLRAGCF
ncbi:MAG: regulatory protein TetR [Caulobacteraceae bacterium]|nr:regulatory protein TetR [Caulobacteraceae bacterium]